MALMHHHPTFASLSGLFVTLIYDDCLLTSPSYSDQVGKKYRKLRLENECNIAVGFPCIRGKLSSWHRNVSKININSRWKINITSREISSRNTSRSYSSYLLQTFQIFSGNVKKKGKEKFLYFSPLSLPDILKCKILFGRE